MSSKEAITPARKLTTDIVVAGTIGLVFGVLDQYLGTTHVTSRLGWWTITVSGMSAPWLILPFLAGVTQDRARRATVLGLVVTIGALAGYFYMSNSAFEGVSLARTWPRMVVMMRAETNLLWIVSGFVTGPLFGYFGHRWRVARSWVAALLVASALCFEPLARRTVGTVVLGGLHGSPVVWTVEVVAGVLSAIVFAVLIARQRRIVSP